MSTAFTSRRAHTYTSSVLVLLDWHCGKGTSTRALSVAFVSFMETLTQGIARHCTRDALINGGAGGELQDPPTQRLGKPRDPELYHPRRGGGGGAVGQPTTHRPTQPPKQYTRHEHWTRWGLGKLEASRFLIKPPSAPVCFEAATRDLCSADFKSSRRAFSTSAAWSLHSQSFFIMCLEMETAADSG